MDPIDRIQAFNRDWTARMGLLGRSYLGTGRTVSEVRVLYELYHREGVTARVLARDLSLDEGYLSRLLKRFEGAGWLDRRPSEEDARRSDLMLTEAGRAAFEPLRSASRAAISDALNGADAGAVADALEDATALIDPAEVELRALAPGDGGWVIERHGAHYSEVEGFDHTFEALVARIVADFLDHHDPARERGWIAWRGGRRIGSIFVVDDGGVAKLRLVYLDAAARGLGLGRRMLEEAMGWAKARGYGRMRLWTHESHRAAGRLYAAAGFEMTGSRAVRTYGRDNVEQTWERDL